MNATIEIIPLARLAWVLLPVGLVIVVFYWWALNATTVFYGLFRMLVQLLLVGYVLLWIFAIERAWVVLALVTGMAIVSGWIALRTVPDQRRALYGIALASIMVGGGSVLLLVTQWVLDLKPWYRPNFFIPLAGMIFSNSMNGISLAADRLQVERSQTDGATARARALHTALIPLVNSLFAVGLVALPGMMTGQILSGVSPLIAARYQIMVMCMLFGAAGLSTILFLWFSRRVFGAAPVDAPPPPRSD